MKNKIDIERIITQKALCLESSNSLSELIGALRKYDKTDALVFNKKKLIGIFDHSLLFKARIDPKKIKIGKITKKVPILTEKDSIKRATRLMYAVNTTSLPYYSQKKLKGIASVFLIFRSAREILDKIKVSSVKHPLVITINENESIVRALRKMSRNGIDRLPVLDSQGSCSGFLSYIDVLEKYYLKAQKPEHTPKVRQNSKSGPDKKPVTKLAVKNCMNKGVPITINENSTLKEASEKMIENQVLSLVILENKKPKRIITKS